MSNAPFEHDKRYHQLAGRQSEIEEKLDLTKNQASSQAQASDDNENEEKISVKQPKKESVRRTQRAAVSV